MAENNFNEANRSSNVNLSEVIAREVSKAIKSSTHAIMEQMESLVDTKMTMVMAGQKRAASEQVSEIKRLKASVDKAYTFKRKGNEKQHNFNAGVLQQVEEVQEIIEDGRVTDATNSLIHSSRTWETLAGISAQDEELSSIFDCMPGVVRSSRAQSTGKTYDWGFRKWTDFAVTKQFTSLPADALQFSFFLCKLIKDGIGLQSFYSVVYGVKWYLDMSNQISPTENIFVKNLMDSAKRVLSKPVTNKKDIVSVSHIKELCNMVDDSNLSQVRDVCMVLLAFGGFLRFSEFSQIKCKDVAIMEDYVRIYIPKSKTDQLRKGAEVVIAVTGNQTCPVAWLKKYCELSKTSLDSDKYLFRPVYKSGKIRGLISKNKKLSYTTCKERIVNVLKQVDKTGNFGLHSFRAGGASAASSKGVSGIALKRHGRWKSDAAKDMYIEDDLGKRLDVSRKLGL